MKEIVRRLDEFRTDIKIVNGVKEYQMRLYEMQDEMLPLNIDIGSDKEKRRTKGSIDALSAVRISMRSGSKIARKR